MNNTTILHTADWHLRDSQYTSLDRGQDFTKAAIAVIDIAMAFGVKAICNCGDILNNKRPSSKNIKDLVLIDKRLRAAGIPMYVISGNHDLARPSWISIVHGQRNTDNDHSGIIDVDNKLITIPNSNGLTIYGVPSLGPTAFRALQPEWPKADILMSHEMVQEFCAFKTEDETLKISDYPLEKYKSILLGDIHTNSYKRMGSTLIGYPGPIEFCSRNEINRKFVTVLEWDKRELVGENIKTVKLPSREIMIFNVFQDLDVDKAVKEIKDNRHKSPIIFVKYDGRMSAVPATLMSVVAGTKSILRCSAYNHLEVGKIFNPEDEVLHLRTPQDFVSDFINPSSELFKMARTLADPDVDHRRIISDYVNEKVYNENNTF